MMVLSLVTLAQAQSVENPLNASFDPHPGTQVPLNITLRDEHGTSQNLKQLLRGKPAVLVLGYYGCPMLCHKVQEGLLDGLKSSELSIGEDFRLLTVSIDPTETSELAAEKKAAYLADLGKPDADAAWPFLVGDSAQINALTKAVGFRSAKLKDQIAHPAGLVILTPTGKISSYLYGIRFPSTALDQAVREAAQEQSSSVVQAVILLCYQYDPSTGRYSLAIYRLIQILGIFTLLTLVSSIAIWNRREKRRRELI